MKNNLNILKWIIWFFGHNNVELVMRNLAKSAIANEAAKSAQRSRHV
ncbi:hypothetical protein [Helicobacter suis]|nr:hypothetical protein [Helicobacter suis]